ncbi:MAG TPA: MXAN_6577-like cysteine-rich protein [Polyangiales bacterium]|nr:MXAN_6577-like cysteine-rich protein [Polyangiales bacterium]
MKQYLPRMFALAALLCSCTGQIEDPPLTSELEHGTSGGPAHAAPTAGRASSQVAGRAAEAPMMSPLTSAGEQASTPECGTGLTSCNGSCVSLSNDAAHCGACGKACASGLTCYEGLCRCASGFDMCGSGCVQIARDPMNCGDCGHACRSDEMCIAGECGCGVGQLRCGDKCISVTSDRNNCGACGTVCDTGDKCANSVCVLDCAQGLTACGETCVNTTNDAMHCGNCTTVCMAGQTCSRSRCRAP